MKILAFTSLFPNAVDTTHGIFIQNRLFDWVGRHNHELQVVAPVPYFPKWPGFGKWSLYSEVPPFEVQGGVSVFHPRYVVTPKIGMALYGLNMYLGSLAAVKKLRTSFDFEVIDTHFVYPDGFAAILLGKVMGKPVVVSARGSDIHSYLRLASIRPLLRFVLQRADAVVAVCGALRDAMIEFGVPADKIHVIGNGIDLTLFRAEDRFAARRQLGLPLDKPLILSVARISEIKGIHHLVAALPRVRRRYENAELLLVGKLTDSSYHRRLKAQISQLGLDSVVHFFGPLPQSALKPWYNACDLFCLCSAREGWPNVLLEAMACGRPIVASLTGGIPEIVSSPDYGFLVNPTDPDALAASIISALEKKWDEQRIIQYAGQHGWHKVSALQQCVLERVVKCHRCTPAPAVSALW